MNLNWQKLSEEEIKIGFRRILKRKYRLPDGTEADYDIVKSGPAVCCLPLTKENKVLMVKIFRPGPEKVLMELPGGFNDKDKSPEEAIEAELLEETGYSGDFELIGSSYEDAYTTMYRYHFIVRNCEKVQEPEREFDEFMEVVELTKEEFIEHLMSGELTDPETGFMAAVKLGWF